MAADVNGDDRISSADIIQVRNIIIGRATEFPQSDSWIFEPSVVSMSGGTATAGANSIRIVGIKMGDLNNSADPRR